MQNYVDLFLANWFRRKLIQWFGPTLVVRVFLYLGFGNWKESSRSRRFIGCVPYALPHQNFLPQLVNSYERDIVPVLARRKFLVRRQLAIIARLLRIKFVWNVAAGTGHTTVELDHMFRWVRSNKKYRMIFLRRPTPFDMGALRLYKDRFWFASKSDVLYDFLLPVIISTPRFRVDCGLSRAKWQLKKNLDFDPPPRDETFYFEISKTQNIEQWAKYLSMRTNTSAYFPLSEQLSSTDAFKNLIPGIETKKIAVVHIKNTVINATASASDPDSYVPTIRWLREHGFTVVLGGREKCPQEFDREGVINYSESECASYENDIRLFSMATVAITAGSGIAYLPDCMGIPYVYLDSWHLAMQMPSPHCTSVPCLVKSKSNGRFLTFKEQSALYLERADKGAEVFPFDSYEAVNAGPEDILSAVKDVLKRAEKVGVFKMLTPSGESEGLSAGQLAYQDILPLEIRAVIYSRISQAFLDKHPFLTS